MKTVFVSFVVVSGTPSDAMVLTLSVITLERPLTFTSSHLHILPLRDEIGPECEGSRVTAPLREDKRGREEKEGRGDRGSAREAA